MTAEERAYAGTADPRPRRVGLGASPLPIEDFDIVTGDTLAALSAMYEAAFGHLRVLAAARQLLTPEEFDEEMQDPRVRKHVAYDRTGQPIALLTLTRDLAAVPWISPEYFAHRYPDHYRRGAIAYLGFILVHPDHQRTAVMERMVDAVVLQPLSAEGAVLAFDTCAHNDDQLRFTERIRGILRRNSSLDWTMTEVDVQRYYDITWA